MNRNRVYDGPKHEFPREIKKLRLSSTSPNLTNKRHFSTISKFNPLKVDQNKYNESLWVLIDRQLKFVVLENFKSKINTNFLLSMRVGISEAIRLLPIFLINIYKYMDYIVYKHYSTFTIDNYKQHSLSYIINIKTNMKNNKHLMLPYTSDYTNYTKTEAYQPLNIKNHRLKFDQ
jgi:hypothetical protein